MFFGIFLTLASSFWGLLLIPQIKLGSQDITEVKETGEMYPLNRAGMAGQGAGDYRSLGCAECHTRIVRPVNLGGDIARGWGHRHSVAQDYIRDYPILLGDMRVGPDLANAGLRYTNATELLKLLYKPQSVNAGAMPSYSFLFEKNRVKAGHQPAPNALQVEGEPSDMEILPKPGALALVSYIMSLRADVNLFEAPLPVKPAARRRYERSCRDRSPRRRVMQFPRAPSGTPANEQKKQNNQPVPKSAASATRVQPAGSRSFTLVADIAEPVADDRPVPVALIILTLVLLYFADLYVMEHGADVGNKVKTGGAFPAIVYDPYTTYTEVESHNPIDPIEEFRREGQKVYKSVAQCVACHQEPAWELL